MIVEGTRSYCHSEWTPIKEHKERESRIAR
jgi:hypothetical protein